MFSARPNYCAQRKGAFPTAIAANAPPTTRRRKTRHKLDWIARRKPVTEQR